MLRFISDELGKYSHLSSAVIAVSENVRDGASLGKFNLFNSALPILKTSTLLGTITSDEIELDLPSDASSVLNIKIAGKVYQPSRSPDNLQPGEYKLDFNRAKIILRLLI
ncbi:MAG: hypothetical protein QNJ38_01380 [Prochloraceae cyanobacterium]|nr:hypothetical protein [Prochloraceae cyanobacterium]